MLHTESNSGVGLSRWPIILYVCTGFTGPLIEQGFERYLLLLVGATRDNALVPQSVRVPGYSKN